MAIVKQWNHYLLWEDYQNGMWSQKSGPEREQYLKKAIKFTGNADRYGKYMLRVIRLWPISCDQNLSDTGMNRKAWIGHAACCLAIGCPEDITREAWGYLTQTQQDAANKKAQEAIDLWERKHERKNRTVYFQMGIPGILGRHPGDGASCS